MRKIFLTSATFVLLLVCNVHADGWWQVWFTHPNSSSRTTAETPEPALVKAINDAKNSVYAAFYDLNSVPVTEALISAKRRGVDVKLVTDNSNYHNKQIGDLERGGVRVVSDNRKELMHNKFAVIDKKHVWTGSYNITKNGENRNNNNAIMITSPELAEIYLDEFKEMYELKIFGNKYDPAPFSGMLNKHYVKISDTDINVFFSPEDNVEKQIIRKIAQAKSSVKFMAFSFTSMAISEAMIKKFKQGIQVQGLFERRGANSADSEFMKMNIENIPVRLDGNRYAMHHKVIIIDDSIVITGSYNFSKNAGKRNDENCLIIHNKDIAELYVKEFNALYAAGKEK